MTAEHDTYVYGPVGRRYHWRCLTCPATSDPKGFRRRMDADDDAGAHEVGEASPTDQREQNRAEMERRYREHLALGPDRCGCSMCRRAPREPRP